MPNSRKKRTCGIIGPRMDDKSGWVYILMDIPGPRVGRRRVNLLKLYADGSVAVRVRQSGKLVKVSKGFIDGFTERLTEKAPQPE